MQLGAKLNCEEHSSKCRVKCFLGRLSFAITEHSYDVMASQMLSQPTPTYSIPILIDKLTQLSLYFPRALDSSRAQLKRVTVIRNQAYLKMAFFIGDITDMAVLEVLERLTAHR